MTDQLSKRVIFAAVCLIPLALMFVAYSMPNYAASKTYLAGLIFLVVLFAAISMYRRFFLIFVIMTFLMAGVNLQMGSGWNLARWITLGAGGMVGLLILIKYRRLRFGLFHGLALFAVLAALSSASVSRYPTLSSLKVLSLLLMFGYAATGARLAAVGRENLFFEGMLNVCEIFVGIVGVSYLSGFEIMGNPNSLGAVMGVVAAPLLLWGTLVTVESMRRRRRLALFIVSATLLVASFARAGILAGSLACGVLCLSLRKYKLLTHGILIIAVIAAACAILRPEAYSNAVSSLKNTVIFKGKDPSAGFLASRRSPWQEATDSIRNHRWFGTGFGTSDIGKDEADYSGNFSTSTATSREYGSSYLAVVTWMGLAGMVPFLALLLVLMKTTVQTIAWMVRNGNPLHPAVPLSMVMLAGLIHAGFEDWLFAPGYYLTIFFWSMAFVFVDYAPLSSSTMDRYRSVPRAEAVRTRHGRVVPTR